MYLFTKGRWTFFQVFLHALILKRAPTLLCWQLVILATVTCCLIGGPCLYSKQRQQLIVLSQSPLPAIPEHGSSDATVSYNALNLLESVTQ